MDPIAFSFWKITIRWYALAYIIGLISGWKIAVYLSRESGCAFDEDDANDFPTWVLVGLMGGARLGYVVFYKPFYYLDHPLEVLQIWQGGMSFHGGLLGIFLAAVLFAQRRRVALGALTDLVVLVSPIGLFLGRLANFVNGELWGRPTDGSFGIIFPNAGAQPQKIFVRVASCAWTSSPMTDSNAPTVRLRRRRSRLGGSRASGRGADAPAAAGGGCP